MGKKFFLRCEFFGGYLFNRYTLDYWMLTKETMLFSILWIETKNKTFAEAIVANFYRDALIDFSVLSMLEDCDCNEKVDIRSYELCIDSCSLLIDTLSRKTYLSYPFELSLYPTFQCQASCKFCFVDHGVKTESVQLSVNDWKMIIDESAAQGATSVAILGGEPTLYKDIADLINHIEEVQIGATITTNGQFLSPEVEEALLSSRYIFPCFSVQSISQRNTELMGVPYDLALHNLKRLINKGKKCGINSVLTTQAFDDIKQIIDFCLEYGVSVYSGSIYFPKNSFESAYSIKDARVLHEKVQEYLYRRSVTGFNFDIEGCMYYSAFHDDITEDAIVTEFEKVSFGCECGNRKLEIACNGYAYPCCVYMGSQQKDHLKRYTSIRELWDNSKSLSYFRNLKKMTPEECRECKFSSFCKGGCPYLITKSGKVLGIQRESRCAVTFQ